MPEYFAQFSCGVGFSALGNGSYDPCYRLANGEAACVSHNNGQPQPVLWDDQTPVTDVLHVSSAGENNVSVVTTAGAIYHGNISGVSRTPVLGSDGIAVTGGRNTKCALIGSGGAMDVRCWKDGGEPYRPALPNDFAAVQVTASYGIACALNTSGEAWCWDEGGNVPQFVSATPAKMDFAEPLVFLSAGQDSICGVKASGGLDCLANWYASPYLPTVGQNGATPPMLRPGVFPEVVAVQAGYHQGVIVNADGSAVLLEGNSVGEDNPGTPFTGVTGVIAAGGDRGVACVLTESGSVHCRLNGGATTEVTAGMNAQAAVCPFD